MQVSTFQGNEDMANAGLYLPRKGRHGEYRVEFWSMQASTFQEKGGIVNEGKYLENGGIVNEGKYLENGGMVIAG